MKFGKSLKDRSIREWEDCYMSYKRLKRIIKKIIVQSKESEAAGADYLADSDAIRSELAALRTGDSTTDWPSSLLSGDARTEFYSELDKDLARVNTFFARKLDEFDAQYWRLSDSNDSVSASGSSSGEMLPASMPLHRGHTITTSQQSQLESKAEHILALYRNYLQLLAFSYMNSEGYRKIVKKFDKYAHESLSDTFAIRLANEQFVIGRAEIESKIEAVEEMFMRVAIARGKEVKQIRSILRAVQRDVEEGEMSPSDGERSSHPWLFLALAVLITALLSSLPLLPIAESSAHKCLVLLALTTVLLVTEALPFFVSSLLIPFLVVTMGILRDENGVQLDADRASKTAFSAMFSDSVALIIGSFALSAAFSKRQFELRLMSMIQRRLATRPRLFLLALMMLAALLSMFISNVASPILLSTLLLPIVRDLGRGSEFARTLLLGLAFSSNVGGMLSPIASPENAIVLGTLEEMNRKHSISWLIWLTLSVPIGLLCILLIWLYLCSAMLRDSAKLPNIPPIILDLPTTAHFSRADGFVAAVTLLTFGLFLSSKAMHDVFGGMSAVALIPLIAFTATGIIGVADVRGFAWHLVLLIAGGSVLGNAVINSELLPLLTDPMLPYLESQPVFVIMLLMLVLLFSFASFVPHIVCSIILTPPVLALGAAIHHTHSLVLSFVFMLHFTMTLPISTFPNVSVWLIEDDFKRPFLSAKDFIRHGVMASATCLGVMATAGYGWSRLVFGKHVF